MRGYETQTLNLLGEKLKRDQIGNLVMFQILAENV